MSAKTDKIETFIAKEARSAHKTKDVDREKAWLLLMEMLKQRNMNIHPQEQNGKSTEEKLAYTRKRLRDIKTGLNLSLKSGVATKTLH